MTVKQCATLMENFIDTYCILNQHNEDESFVDDMVQRQELTEKAKQLVIEAGLYPINYIKEFQSNARFRIYQEPLRFLRT